MKYADPGGPVPAVYHYCVTLSNLLSFGLVSCLEKRRQHHSIYLSCSFVRIQWVVLCCDGLSRSALSDFCNPMDCQDPPSRILQNSPGKNTGMDGHALLQGIFPTQGTNPGLPHCRWILYHLSHEGIPWILEWVAYPFSRGSSWPGNRTGVSSIAGRFFTSSATREAHPMS